MAPPAVGGSVESVTIRGRIFAVAADAEVNKKNGGFENEVQPNGNGSARLIKTRVSWKLDGVQLEISDAKGDAEFLQEIADGFEFVPCTITMASSIVYQGKGTITGEVQVSSQNATATVSLEGEGTLTQQ
jgi:hypothetical protein